MFVLVQRNKNIIFLKQNANSSKTKREHLCDILLIHILYFKREIILSDKKFSLSTIFLNNTKIVVSKYNTEN